MMRMKDYSLMLSFDSLNSTAMGDLTLQEQEKAKEYNLINVQRQKEALELRPCRPSNAKGP